MTAVADSLVIAQRNVRRILRQLDWLIFFTIQPVMFVVLFVYVFGGAIQTPGYDYVDFLMPGILVQTIVFGSALTGVGLAEDLHKGLMDRFRSLPMARSAVLAGRTAADVVTNAFQTVVMLVVAYIVGFRFSTSVPEVVLGLVLLLMVGYSFSWVSALIGMSVSSVEAAQSAGFIWMFPLTFVSSAFVPTDSMPAALQWFADINPITIWVNALRGLFVGAPLDGEVWQGLLWIAGIVVAFAPLAVAKYRRIATA
jgi:ABC-2 type transport system permease protein/oleandomycin transport system permease protein